MCCDTTDTLIQCVALFHRSRKCNDNNTNQQANERKHTEKNVDGGYLLLEKQAVLGSERLCSDIIRYCVRSTHTLANNKKKYKKNVRNRRKRWTFMAWKFMRTFNWTYHLELFFFFISDTFLRVAFGFTLVWLRVRMDRWSGHIANWSTFSQLH